MAKHVLQVTVSVSDEITPAALLRHMNDALSIGCEQMDQDSELEMPGIVGRFSVVSTEG